MSGRGSGAGVGFALLGGVGLLVIAIVLAALGPGEPAAPAPIAAASERYPNAWPSPPPAEVAALLGGLGPGSTLGDAWRVRGVSPVHEQRVVVDVGKGEVGFRVVVMLKERDSRLPPKSTTRYALYTVQPRPNAEALEDSDYSGVLNALAALIEKSEATAPVPAGL